MKSLRALDDMKTIKTIIIYLTLAALLPLALVLWICERLAKGGLPDIKDIEP